MFEGVQRDLGWIPRNFAPNALFSKKKTEKSQNGPTPFWKTGLLFTIYSYLDVMLSAVMNSRKSILPSLLTSNVRKTCVLNFSASPSGNKLQ